ncbi:related to Arginine biosynthesis bifunctional protein ArgJ, mitochondrial [Ramularia collo-cygni]|uniref:Arginine biosynthesis bifunctional protein ArgJ, mitochondrial n=1 Tax=Ramularia collo-cygni TaxID=112498 RepID=A0A2D3V7E9_9PEZI|nr:related to Arginine biosynthesis bifunctional protein ArgJ, mitochondrial [Ramularia collo-cygni]CZT21360.1 related to Arginine biosynthesis bifunctional protein ArgJ, mitochondrial [Ramularia collo-cygni]
MAPKNLSMRRIFAAAIQIRSYSAPAERSIPAAKQKYVPTSGTYPKGFLAGSAFAGVKASNTKYDDLALIVSEVPCPGAAVFTRNMFRAAPVKVSGDILRLQQNKNIRGVVINSGCANAVTGKLGLEHAEAMSRATDKLFGADDASLPETLVMSTGVIGQRLPIDRITSAIPKLHASLGSTHEHWLGAAQAICTTDTFPKLMSRTFTLPSHPETTYSIAGMTKGAGMIHPNMATLLATVCTDAAIDPDTLAKLLRHHTQTSFNSISIDGDTSTNDTLACFANGAATPEGVQPMAYDSQNVNGKSDDLRVFEQVFSTFLKDLAKLVVRDGEGATKFVTIRVRSDVSFVTAKRVAVSIARSALVKTALYGKDANWGRILCAIGYAPGLMSSFELDADALKIGEQVKLDRKLARMGKGSGRQDASENKRRAPVVNSRTSVSFIPSDGSKELKLLVCGEPEAVDEVRAKEILEMEDLEILVRLEDGTPRGDGPVRSVREAVFWTCDFSHEYVTINGDYRT